MNPWVVIILGGLFTLAIRSSIILAIDKINMPDWFKRSLRYIPTAILSAIILPGLFAPEGKIAFSLHNTEMLSGLVAIGVAWWTKNVVLTILVGIASLVILRLALGGL